MTHLRDFETATRAYEKALAKFTVPEAEGLEQKKKQMAKDSFRFLRATYYRWAEIFPELCPELAKSPQVLGVGDLHVQNFGTWRDEEGRLVWGVDDSDEADENLPMGSDLVRLAVSALLAKNLKIGPREICSAVLEGYSKGLKSDEGPYVLDDDHDWLRQLAKDALKPPQMFWGEWLDEKSGKVRTDAVPAGAQEALRVAFPDGHEPEEYRRPNPKKPKGLGSLGKPRFYGYTANFSGGPIAREAKAAVPPATKIETTRKFVNFVERIQARAIRSLDPLYTLIGKWRSAKEGSWVTKPILASTGRIELEKLEQIENERRLLRAMGHETANIHRGSRTVEELRKGCAEWETTGTFINGVEKMRQSIEAEYKKWAGSHAGNDDGE